MLKLVFFILSLSPWIPLNEAFANYSSCEGIFEDFSEELQIIRNHHAQSNLKIGGLTLAQAFDRGSPIPIENEFYTPENAEIVQQMIHKLQKLQRYKDFIPLINDSEDSDQVLAVVWNIPEIQALIAAAIKTAHELMENNYPQNILIDFINQYTFILSLPMNLADYLLLSENDIKAYDLTDFQRNQIILNNLVGKFQIDFNNIKPAQIEISKNLRKRSSLHLGPSEFTFNRKKFRVILVNGHTDEYILSRFYHLGLVPVGIFSTASVYFDGTIETNRAATNHDKTHWYTYVAPNRNSFEQENFERARIQNELIWMRIDNLQRTLTEDRWAKLKYFIFGEVHERGFSIKELYKQTPSEFIP